MNTRPPLLRSVGVVVAILAVAWIGIGAAVRSLMVPGGAASVETLRLPIDLQRVGDTLSVCGVLRFRDGSVRLGHTALLLRVDPDGTIIAREVRDVRARCALLLRQRGMNPSMPTVRMKWDATVVPSRLAPRHTLTT
jgi:hypothetical protein